MNFIEEMKKRARTDIKTIVLPEAEDKRVLEAASKVEKEAFAKIILIGNIEKTKELAKENNIDITNIKIIDPETSEKYEGKIRKLVWWVIGKHETRCFFALDSRRRVLPRRGDVKGWRL